MSRRLTYLLIAAIAVSWALLPAQGQTTWYVATNGVDSRDGTNWDTALLTISNALAKTAASGDTILVSNGTYGLTATNLFITNGVELRSLAGATNTMIRRTGAGTFRILYISNVNAVVDGFTISNGTLPSINNVIGGGILIDAVGTVSNCIIRGNTVPQNGYGGGVALNGGGIVRNCQIVSNLNVSRNGGGAYFKSGGVIENCEIKYNSCGGSGMGGGAYLSSGGLLRNCLISHNSHGNLNRSASYWPTAGGVYCGSGGTVENCTIVSNVSAGAGGLACEGGGTILNTIIYHNQTTLCDGAPNVSNEGSGWSYTNCCTTPAVPGVSNTTAAPEFTDVASGNFRLLPGSPCIDTGANRDWMTNALDLDGNPRILNTNVDMGAYEFKIGALACSPNGTPVTGFLSNAVVFTAGVAGTNTAGLYYRWDFENDSAFDIEGPDRQVVTNLYMPGLYSVRLAVTNAIGESAECVRSDYIKVAPAIAYVATNGSAIYPYTNWAEAATNIQPAIDAGEDGTLVLVSNGLYGITSQVELKKGMTIRSVNGASNTVVRGKGSGDCRVFCISHSNAVVDGFTMTNGYVANAYGTGGGLLIQVTGSVVNCIIAGNRLDYNAYGAGVYFFYGGGLRNCRIIGNSSASFSGGGVYFSGGGVVENCVIMNNSMAGASSGRGGGVYMDGGGLLRNCLVYSNLHGSIYMSGQYWPNAGGVQCQGGGTVENCTIVSNYCASVGGLICSNGGVIRNTIIYGNMSSNPATLNYVNSGTGWSYTNCCTTPAVAGDGNITDEPQFKEAAAGDFRLMRASPCVNAGTNQPWMLPADGGAADLAGNRRIYFNRVDLGAYEVVPSKGTMLATW